MVLGLASCNQVSAFCWWFGLVVGRLWVDSHLNRGGGNPNQATNPNHQLLWLVAMVCYPLSLSLSPSLVSREAKGKTIRGLKGALFYVTYCGFPISVARRPTGEFVVRIFSPAGAGCQAAGCSETAVFWLRFFCEGNRHGCVPF